MLALQLWFSLVVSEVSIVYANYDVPLNWVVLIYGSILSVVYNIDTILYVYFPKYAPHRITTIRDIIQKNELQSRLFVSKYYSIDPAFYAILTYLGVFALCDVTLYNKISAVVYILLPSVLSLIVFIETVHKQDTYLYVYHMTKSITNAYNDIINRYHIKNRTNIFDQNLNDSNDVDDLNDSNDVDDLNDSNNVDELNDSNDVDDLNDSNDVDDLNDSNNVDELNDLTDVDDLTQANQ